MSAHLDDSLKTLLRSTHGGTAVSKLEAAASALRGLAEGTETVAAEAVNEAADALQREIDELKRDLDAASNMIQLYQADNDKILPQMLQIADAAIYDFTTATDAAREYNRGWFQRALLSENAKVEFAAYLVDLISPFTKSNLDTLRMIGGRDPDVLDSIRFPDTGDE